MKEKDEDGKIVICPKCKKEKTISVCESHKNTENECHYCHLMEQHMKPWEADKPDDKKSKEDKTKPKKKEKKK